MERCTQISRLRDNKVLLYCIVLCTQALFNMSRVKESMIAFNNSLHILGSLQPYSCREIYHVTMREALQQCQHRRWPTSRLGMAR